MTRENEKLVQQETSTLLPMSTPETNPTTWRSNKFFWASLVAVGVGVGLSVAVVRSNTPTTPLTAGMANDYQPKVLVTELEGKSQGKHKHKHKNKSKSKSKGEELSVCEDGGYSKRTLQLAYELPFASLFRDNKGQKKYEASSVIIVDDNAYAVCDSSWSISKFGTKLKPFSESNAQIGSPTRKDEDSGYEALFHEDGTFYVVRESVMHDDDSYHAVIEELVLGDDDYEVGQVCSSEFEFEGASKGFEGAVGIRDLDGVLTVLGLCEGNFCSESRKDEVGNGRLVAMQKETLEDGTCQWATIRTIKVPVTAKFRDYSAMTVSDTGRVAISSQEESQLWTGQLLGKNSAGLWDLSAIEFDLEKKAKVFDFPKNDSCETIFCNIEGVHWINDDMILAVSDKMKSRGKQSFHCFEHDQSVHVFVLP